MSKTISRSVVFEVDGVESVIAVKVKSFSGEIHEEAQRLAMSEMMQRGYVGVRNANDYGNTLYFGYDSLDGEPSVNNWWLRFSDKPNCYVFEGIR